MKQYDKVTILLSLGFVCTKFLSVRYFLGLKYLLWKVFNLIRESKIARIGSTLRKIEQNAALLTFQWFAIENI